MAKHKIITWNVNGIRAVARKGLDDWIKEKKANVFCFQEIKATEDVLPPEVVDLKKFERTTFPAERKGYSGVMTLSKTQALENIKGLKSKKFSNEGRTIISVYEKYVLLNCYFPNGRRDHERVPFKLEYYDEMLKKLKSLKKKYKRPIIICGDFNTAHHEVDLANPKTNKKTTGFLPEERKWLGLYEQAGFVDCFRHLYPDTDQTYSWWSYRGNCRARNVGWRIDYFFIDKESIDIVKECKYLYEDLGSDHCPVELTISI